MSSLTELVMLFTSLLFAGRVFYLLGRLSPGDSLCRQSFCLSGGFVFYWYWYYLNWID